MLPKFNITDLLEGGMDDDSVIDIGKPSALVDGTTTKKGKTGKKKAAKEDKVVVEETLGEDGE